MSRAEDQIRRLRIHLADMKAEAQGIRWDCAKKISQAETIEQAHMRLETLIDKLEADMPKPADGK